MILDVLMVLIGFATLIVTAISVISAIYCNKQKQRTHVSQRLTFFSKQIVHVKRENFSDEKY